LGSGLAYSQTLDKKTQGAAPAIAPAQKTTLDTKEDRSHLDVTSAAAQTKAEKIESKTSSQNAADEAQAGKHTRAMGKETTSQSDLDAKARVK